MSNPVRHVVFTFCVAILFARPAAAQIRNIRQFLDQCPQSDPAIATIRADFQLRRDGAVVSQIPPCTEPVSAMPTSAYTDELIVLQGLRVIYYMDRGQAGHLPWTSGTMYDWMKSKIGGIDIVQGTSFCCEVFGWTVPFPPLPPGTPPPVPPSSAYFIGVGAEDDFNREFDKGWPGISGNIGLYAHETRHRDGYSHTSCCGIPGGCDQTFNAKDLTPYAIQWWLDDLWLTGKINVGMACLPAASLQSALNWFYGSLNGSGFPARFCDARPAVVDPPANPGGVCLDVSRRRAVKH
jgi:hypothetical protein